MLLIEFKSFFENVFKEFDEPDVTFEGEKEANARKGRDGKKTIYCCRSVLLFYNCVGSCKLTSPGIRSCRFPQKQSSRSTR